MANYNFGNDELGYSAVVDGFNLNLTPLGKQLMPPPMFEKQVIFPGHPVCVSMYGNYVTVADNKNQIYFFNCE